MRWGIVGGGMLGLALARTLRGQGHDVTVLEAASEFGGLASAWRLGDLVWDKFYHVICLSDQRVRKLLAEIGLADQLEWRTTRTGFFADGQLHSLSSSVEFLRFPPLGLIDKLRLGATIFCGARRNDWQALERIPVEAWVRKWGGARVADKFWLPLLRSKLGEGYKETSAAFLWATIQRLYAARRSGLKREMFGYVRGGYSAILDRFTASLRKAGVALRAGFPARRVEPLGAGVAVRGDAETLAFDRVVVTAPAPIAADLCGGLGAEAEARLRGVRMQGIVCAAALLRKPLAGYYVTNLADAGIPFTGVIETSALVDPAEFGGLHLAYLPKYVPPGDPLFDDPDEAIRQRCVAALHRIYGGFQADDVEAFRVARARHVFALPTLGYSERAPAFRTATPGLFVVNAAQIVNGTLNVEETLALAERFLAEAA